MPKQQWKANSLADIDYIAKDILALLKHKKVAFFGEMGSGKTAIVKSMCKKLGINNAQSPTFTILNEYSEKNNMVYHFDFYRIKNIEEAYDIGYEEYFFSGDYVFVEWPEKVLEIIDEEFVIIKIEILKDNSRKIQVL